jgi:hypothetical protein
MIAITALVLVLILTLATLIVWASDISSSKLLAVVLLALLAFLSISSIVLAHRWFLSRLMLVILLLNALVAADLVLQLTSKKKARAWAKWTIVALASIVSIAIIVQIGNPRPSRQADSDSGSEFRSEDASPITDNISRIPQQTVTQPIPIPYARQADSDLDSGSEFDDNNSPQPSLQRETDGMRQNRYDRALRELGWDNTGSDSGQTPTVSSFTNETGPFGLSPPLGDEQLRKRLQVQGLGRSW